MRIVLNSLPFLFLAVYLSISTDHHIQSAASTEAAAPPESVAIHRQARAEWQRKRNLAQLAPKREARLLAK